MALDNNNKFAQRKRFLKQVVIVIIGIIAGLLHFVAGPQYRGPFIKFVNWYLIDITLPFAAYFLLTNIDKPWLRSGIVKSVIVLSFGLVVEFAQLAGIPILGETFDPLDILMYASGVSLAFLVDSLVFRKLLWFWKADKNSE